jgi:hypothetical protein
MALKHVRKYLIIEILDNKGNVKILATTHSKSMARKLKILNERVYKKKINIVMKTQ